MAELLATVDDVEARIGRSLTTTEAAQVQALLVDASAAIRGYTGRTFAAETKTVRRRARCGVIRLGHDDITAVSAVRTITGTDVSYSWDGLDAVSVGGDAVRFDLDFVSDLVADVTYTRGSDDVPGEIRAVAVNVAARALGVPADEGGIQQESVQGYSYTVGAAAAAGGVGLLPAERAVLDRYRQVVGVVWAR